MSSEGPYALHTLEESAALAREALRRAPEGGLLLLAGPLGSGKTTFTQLLAKELGSSAAVSSPTYTLVHEYPTPEGVLVHIDAYRLPDRAQLRGALLDDYLDRARLVVVEWGEELAPHYPHALLLRFSLSAEGAELTRTAEWISAPGSNANEAPAEREP